MGGASYGIARVEWEYDVRCASVEIVDLTYYGGGRGSLIDRDVPGIGVKGSRGQGVKPESLVDAINVIDQCHLR